MGLVEQQIEAAGLGFCLKRIGRGERLTNEEADQIRNADILLIGALADRMRAKHHGDEVWLVRGEPRDENVYANVAHPPEDCTGIDKLRSIALARLTTDPDVGLAVDCESIGLQLAQVALTFGANVVVRAPINRHLTILGGGTVERDELNGLIERAGRTPRLAQPAVAAQGDPRV